MAMSPSLRRLLFFLLFLLFASLAAPQTTNPTDLSVVHELMSSINSDSDWRSLFPDPCLSSPQGILCTPDPVTNILYVTELHFGYISPVANLIPCSPNASIPLSISRLTHLESLSFSNCFTSSRFPVTLPPTLPALSSLKLLSFTSNPALTGPLPPGLHNLTLLQRLVLSQNALQGSLPDDLGLLHNLIQLDLSHNQLSGAIPSSLANMSALLNMDLRYNALEGPFPASFAQGLLQVQRVALSYNKLTGSLPSQFAAPGMGACTFLDLSHNSISGEIPESLAGALSSLEDLFLNSNSLSGGIPESVGLLTNLVRLDLSNCEIGKAIPESLQKLRRLRFFSVSNNRLWGGIPMGLATLPRLFTLNLDGNRLSGPVPFPASFVERMGRNMKLEDNPGLCYSQQLVNLKAPLALKRCPEDNTNTAPTVAPVAPVTVTSPNEASRHARYAFLAWSCTAAALAVLW